MGRVIIISTKTIVHDIKESARLTYDLRRFIKLSPRFFLRSFVCPNNACAVHLPRHLPLLPTTTIHWWFSQLVRIGVGEYSAANLVLGRGNGTILLPRFILILLSHILQSRIHEHEREFLKNLFNRYFFKNKFCKKYFHFALLGQ